MSNSHKSAVRSQKRQNMLYLLTGVVIGFILLGVVTSSREIITGITSVANTTRGIVTNLMANYISLVNPPELSQFPEKDSWHYYTPITTFSSSLENTTLADLVDYATLPPENTTPTKRLLFLEDDQAALEKILLVNLPTEYRYLSINDLAKSLSQDDIALIPVEMITPTYKLLTLNDKNITALTNDLQSWPLKRKSTESNFKPELVSTVVLTGVTAISRGVEDAIASRNDPIFPARGVMTELSQADITHVNSENPFFDSCEPKKEGVVLCGKATSIQSLTAIGTDIVDLAGNHQNDYGTAKNIESINHLHDAGFETYGGGLSAEEAALPIIKTVNGTTFAFLGYAYFDSQNGPKYRSLAYKDQPGANYYSEDKLKADIESVRDEVDIVVVDFQFIEQYSYRPLLSQKNVFRKAIDLGADIVVGVQAHQPQDIEFYNDRIIFYGLGNLFFDQMWSEPTRQGLIPKLTFYDGELVSIHVYTTLLHDYAQPRFTSGEEREKLLKEILPKN